MLRHEEEWRQRPKWWAVSLSFLVCCVGILGALSIAGSEAVAELQGSLTWRYLLGQDSRTSRMPIVFPGGSRLIPVATPG
jgi:hypothetical protein